jgi:hypothetical protein
VQLEGHGRTVWLAPGAYVVRLGQVAPEHPDPAGLLVSSSASGDVASALVASTGPAATATHRPGAEGPVAEAGVGAVTDGPAGAWHVRFDGVRFPWPEGTVLRAVTDDHPGDELPLFVGRDLSDELIALYGMFDAPPPFEEFIAPGQEVVRRTGTGGDRALELAYTYGGQRWHQHFFWVPTQRGVLVVKAQQLEGSALDLVPLAQAIAAGLTVD